MEGRTNMDENAAKFSEKMKELLALAKKKKNVLEYQEISDFSATWSWMQSSLIRFWNFLSITM